MDFRTLSEKSNHRLISFSELCKISDYKSSFKEGKILRAQVLARQNNHLLIKLKDVLLPLKTEFDHDLGDVFLMKVEKVLPEKIIFNLIEANKSYSGKMINNLDLSFELLEKTISEKSTNLQIKDGESFSGRIINLPKGNYAIKSNDLFIPVKINIESFLMEQVVLKQIIKEDKLLLIDSFKKGVLENTPGNFESNPKINEFGSKNNNIILQEMLKLADTENTRKFVLQNPENISGSLQAGDQKYNTVCLKNIFLKFANTDPEIYENLFGEMQKEEQIYFSRIKYNSKFDALEASFKENKLILQPVFEFNEEQPVFFKLQQKGQDVFFVLDNENFENSKEFLKNISLKTGSMYWKNQDVVIEIINKIIENNLPLSDENIKRAQTLMNILPIDPKTSLELIFNQELFLGLFCQLRSSDDIILLKGFQEKSKRDDQKIDYSFSILYESENLGMILVDLKWSGGLSILFFCNSQKTAEKINGNLEELIQKLRMDNIKIRVEYNPGVFKKEPIRAEYPSISDIDFKV